MFTFPLRHADSRALGALDLYRDEPGGLSSDSMRAAQTLADVAAAYLINAEARAELKDSSDRSREATLHDPLTGLPNRVLLLERLRQATLRGRRSSATSVLLFVDLNRFKAINDTYGHRTGDELLIEVGKRLAGVLRPSDTLARLAGDEFGVLCEELADPAEGDAIVARIEAELLRPFVLSVVEVEITASIGMAFTSAGNHPPEQLLHDADLAMYRTKRESSTPGLAPGLRQLEDAEHQIDIVAALPLAAERGELHVAYQPIVTATDGRMTGLEALLRWTHPVRGPIPPTTLVPLAERSGLIVEIGRWVLERAWADRNRWQQERSEDLAVAVNVSAHQLMSAGFTGTIAAVLEASGTDPGLLTLEVTESVFVRDAERALVVLNELKDLGVMLALDDFGTGYSSLSYLMRYPVDYIKVDREFVANLGRDRASNTIVTALVQLGHGLGMPVISESVETDEQHHHLRRLGCDYCQGFYFARPMPRDRIDALLAERTDGTSPRLPRDPATRSA